MVRLKFTITIENSRYIQRWELSIRKRKDDIKGMKSMIVIYSFIFIGSLIAAIVSETARRYVKKEVRNRTRAQGQREILANLEKVWTPTMIILWGSLVFLFLYLASSISLR